jgi:sporulation protein YlmC with PRC-barrel domain
LHARQLFDKEVIGRTGTVIGRVEDLGFDPGQWRVLSLQVKLEGPIAEQFGMKKRFGSTQVTLSVDHVQGVSDRIVLKMDVDELLKLVASSAQQAGPGSHGPGAVGGAPSSTPPAAP